MICRHCGKELIAVTMYMEAGVFGTAGAPTPQPRIDQWLPLNTGETYTIFFPGVTASVPCVPNVWPAPLCQHEPAPEYVDTTGAAANRPAITTYPTGSCGEYLSATSADGGEQP